MTAKQTAVAEAREKLSKLIKPGDTIHTILRHVSASGMTRHIDCYAVKGGETIYLSGYVAAVLEERRNKQGAIVVGGCGMDMGYHIVHNLGYAMFPKGFLCTGKRCPHNDHSNGDRNYKRHKHKFGGYAFRHNWL